MADEAPAIEDICGLKDVLDSFSSCDKLVELVFSEKCATKTSLTYLWEKKVLPLLKEATTGLTSQAWTGMSQTKRHEIDEERVQNHRRLGRQEL